MLKTTIGQLALNQALPEDMRDYNRVFVGDKLKDTFTEIAKRYPDHYSDILKHFADVGREVSYYSGGMSPTLDSLRTSVAHRKLKLDLHKRLESVLDSSLGHDEKQKAIIKLVGDHGKNLSEDIFNESMAEGNPIAMQIHSGSKGSKANLQSLRGSDLLYVDHRDRVIPFPVLRSYSQGLSPAEFFAGAFGARKGLIDVKMSVRDAGFLCLADDTVVRMADMTTKAIKDIKPGDWVRGADKAGSTFPVEVLRVHDNGQRECHSVRFSLSDTQAYALFVEATLDHKILAVAGESREIDIWPLGEEAQHYAAVRSDGQRCQRIMISRLGLRRTLDIEVGHPDHLFVLANGLIVSNSKQLTQASHRLLVMAKDSDDPEYQNRGLPVPTEDPDNEGALLARDAGGYKRNTVLTPRILRDLKGQMIHRLLVRSPITGGPPDGGVYSSDVGMREKNTLPPLGDMVGKAAADAIGEPVSQGGLSSKHCLAATTLVRMADDTTKAIREVKPGDRVLGCTIHGKTLPVKVLAVYDNGDRIVSRYCFRTRDSRVRSTVLCTKDHKLLVYDNTSEEFKLRPASKLTYKTKAAAVHRGTSLATVDHSSDENNQTKRAAPRVLFDLNDHADLECYDGCEPEGRVPTFDIEVDHPDHLFVLASGLVVSNSGGVLGSTHRSVGGFKTINQMIQTPKVYQGGAAHAQVDGQIEKIAPGPAGGQLIVAAGHQHFVPQGQEISVKVGDHIEAGDTLSDGLINPDEIVRHKGIGEGRKYFVDAFREVMKASGLKAHRRNIELLSRGLINHVRLTDEVGAYVPDDVVPYNVLEHSWQPRHDAFEASPKQALGHYLEKPVLHYSIGTKVRPSVVKELNHFGVGKITAHKEPPPWEPEMIRGMEQLSHDPDWITRMLGSYLQKGLLRGAHRGDVSDRRGTSFVPAVVNIGTLNREGKVQGFERLDPGYHSGSGVMGDDLK